MEIDAFLNLYRAVRASAILRTADQQLAREAMRAAVRGGFRVIEFTLSIPNAIDLIREFSADPNLVVGAGTVLTPEEARQTVAAGAKFLVSPVVDQAVIDESKKLGVAMMPGCSTPTEMLQAYRGGAALQKLFPAPGTGPLWVAQTLGPLPFLRIVPTSGVTLENAVQYLNAGAFAVGFVNSLFDPADVKNQRWDIIESRARAMLAAVQA